MKILTKPDEFIKEGLSRAAIAYFVNVATENRKKTGQIANYLSGDIVQIILKYKWVVEPECVIQHLTYKNEYFVRVREVRGQGRGMLSVLNKKEIDALGFLESDFKILNSKHTIEKCINYKNVNQ